MGEHKDTEIVPAQSGSEIIPEKSTVMSAAIREGKDLKIDKYVQGNDLATNITTHKGTLNTGEVNYYIIGGKNIELPDDAPENVKRAVQQIASADVKNESEDEQKVATPVIPVKKPKKKPKAAAEWPLDMDTSRYNLIVNLGIDFTKDKFDILASRCLTEYMDEDLIQHFKKMDRDKWAEIQKYPALVMNEEPGSWEPDAKDQSPYIYIGYIEKVTSGYRNNSVIWHPMECLERNVAKDLCDYLEITGDQGEAEMIHTHWSLKRVNLLKILSDKGGYDFEVPFPIETAKQEEEATGKEPVKKEDPAKTIYNNSTIYNGPVYNGDVYQNHAVNNTGNQEPPGMEAMLTQFAGVLNYVGKSVMQPTAGTKPGHINRSLCNIIVYGEITKDTTELSLRPNCCLVQRNFTAKEICDRFIALGNDEIYQLREVPAIVTEETARTQDGGVDSGQKAYIGFIDDITVTRKEVIIKWHPVCYFKRKLLYDILDELQIDGEPKIGELTTSHWSMKAIDVLSVLKKVGVEI